MVDQNYIKIVEAIITWLRTTLVPINRIVEGEPLKPVVEVSHIVQIGDLQYISSLTCCIEA